MIGNAVQYTDTGQVEVVAHQTPSTVVVSVIDTGRGLAPEHKEPVFERFHRVDTDTEGTGVGLAIARTLLVAHGGWIEAESAGLGHGSTFMVRLPTSDDRDFTTGAE